MIAINVQWVKLNYNSTVQIGYRPLFRQPLFRHPLFRQPLFRHPLFRQSQSRPRVVSGRVGSVRDFWASRGWIGTVQICWNYSSGNLRKQWPDAIVPYDQRRRVLGGQKSRRGRKLQCSDRRWKFQTEFRRRAANFRQRRLWVLKISILPLNFLNVFSPEFCIFGRKCSDKKKIFRQFSDSPKFSSLQQSK